MKLALSACAVVGVKGALSINNNSNSSLTIVNGDPTEYKQWRGTVAVRSSGLCSGVLIDPVVVLSAAHCCRDAVSSIRIQGGSNVQNAPIAYPPVIDKRTQESSDLCMLHLASAMPADIPWYDVATNDPKEMEQATLVGYGYNTQGFPQGGLGIARQGQALVEVVYGDTIEVGLTKQCACNGDSGGPMFILENNKMKVAGVTSAGLPGCLAGGPAIYASLLTTGAKNWLRTSFLAMTRRDYVDGNGNAGDCTVCPGFPPVSEYDKDTIRNYTHAAQKRA